MPSDSRDTGQIEQDADYWLGIYRESVYNKDVSPEYKGFTELEVRLNRHGSGGVCYMDMVDGSFREIDEGQYSMMDHQVNAYNGNDL